MDIAAGPYQEGDAARFTGRVWLGPGLPSTGGTGMTVVHFSAGARTHWHAHPGGQLLYGVSGRGRVRSRGGPGHTLTPGTSSTSRRASGTTTAAGPTARWRTSP